MINFYKGGFLRTLDVIVSAYVYILKYNFYNYKL